MEAYGKESKDGKRDLIHGKFEHMLDTASRVAGLTNKQYRDWRGAGKLEEKKRTGEAEAYQREGREEKQQKDKQKEKRAQKDKTNEEHRKKRREDKREK